jgi:hypothetical protein
MASHIREEVTALFLCGNFSFSVWGFLLLSTSGIISVPTKKQISMYRFLNKEGKMSRNSRLVFWRMVEEESHKKVLMGSYADWPMFMRLMKIVGVPLPACRSADGLPVDSTVWCVHAQAGPRVRPPQAAGPCGLTRTRFSQPLNTIPPSHIEQARPPSTPSAPRPPPAVG